MHRRFPGGGFIVIAANPSDVEAVYGIDGVLGPYDGNLPNDSGTVRVRNAMDAILLELEYEDEDPWPVAADGQVFVPVAVIL